MFKLSVFGLPKYLVMQASVVGSVLIFLGLPLVAIKAYRAPPCFDCFLLLLFLEEIRSDQIRFVMYMLPNRVQNTAMRNLRLIDGSGLYAVHTIRACFYLRMQTVNSYAVNPETLSSNPARLSQTSFCAVRVHDRAHTLSCFDDPATGMYASLDILK
jgi:hypothetical protein